MKARESNMANETKTKATRCPVTDIDLAPQCTKEEGHEGDHSLRPALTWGEPHGDHKLVYVPTEVDPSALKLMEREGWRIEFDGVIVTLELGRVTFKPHPSIDPRVARWQS